MSPEVRDAGPGVWCRWLVATFVGWVVGVIVASVLSYLVVSLFYPKETTLIVGLCMAAGVALAQKIAVRRSVPLAGRWVWGAAVGLGAPFMAATIVDELWFSTAGLSRGWPILIAVVGGALAGVLQAGALRPHTSRAHWWTLASLMSWGLACLTSTVLGEAGFLLGGVVLGGVSGGLLIWLLGSPPTAEAV